MSGLNRRRTLSTLCLCRVQRKRRWWRCATFFLEINLRTVREQKSPFEVRFENEFGWLVKQILQALFDGRIYRFHLVFFFHQSSLLYESLLWLSSLLLALLSIHYNLIKLLIQLNQLVIGKNSRPFRLLQGRSQVTSQVWEPIHLWSVLIL